MSIDQYWKARKLGLRAYHDNLQAKKSPYLPTLDDRVNDHKSLTHINLGLMPIPLERVVGTVTRGRSNAFAANFMPLLEPNCEFAIKWSLLYDDVAENGVKHPITVLEYMNDYYLIEGNKRVSVMKFLEAVFVEAEVTRVMPRRANDAEHRAYFEYLPFQRDSGINEIYFDKPGSFPKLMELTGHKANVPWTSEERMDFRAAYRYFVTEYRNVYGDRPPAPDSEAFLTYLSIFGYDDAKNKSSFEINEDLKRLKSDFERGQSGESVNLILDRAETRSGGLLSALFRPSKVKAAFLYHRSPQESGWNYWHDLGRINAQNALGDKMETTVRVAESPERFDDEIDALISEGNRVIFATSPLMLNACVRPSVEHPEVKILCCSLLASSHRVRSYYLRIYEAKFLIGMIAGLTADNNKIGYIADYPIYGAAASVNAFALGARMVNPRAKVILRWSTQKDFSPDDPFGDPEIRVISNRDINAPRYSSKEYGLYALDGENVRNLAIPVLDWSRFYQAVVESVLSGSFDAGRDELSAQDYWWGMSSDALDVILSSHFDPGARRLIHTLQSGMQSDQFWPFEGEIRDQKGEIRCGAEERLTPAEILCMDYLVDNVLGQIPSVESLRESAQPLARLQGLEGRARPDASQISWEYNG